MVIVGKSEDNAKTLLGDIQAELQYNQRYIADFGEQYNAGSWEEGKFVTQSEEHCTLNYRVIHVFFLKGAITRHVCNGLHFLRCPFGSP